MIRTTIGDIIDGKLDYPEDIPEDYIVYIVRDDKIIFYIGKSESSVLDRLFSHFGRGSFGWAGYSFLNQFVKNNLPESRDWQIELYTGEECILVLENITNYKRYTDSDGTSCLMLREIAYPDGTRLIQRIKVSNVKGLERELIRALKPCLNTKDNPNPTSLPEKYQIVQNNTVWEKVEKLIGLDDDLDVP